MIHVWRPFDSFFRLITARRNPNLVILTPAALLGRPDVGILLVALWTALSLVVHAVQIVQGLSRPPPRADHLLAERLMRVGIIRNPNSQRNRRLGDRLSRGGGPERIWNWCVSMPAPSMTCRAWSPNTPAAV